jgi:threonine/homoserine/homoserine lactone efflux protein
LTLVFLLIALPSMTAWALLGAGSARWLNSPRALRWFNQSLAGFVAGVDLVGAAAVAPQGLNRSIKVITIKAALAEVPLVLWIA